MMQGPGLHETGRIGDMSPEPLPPGVRAISPATMVIDSNQPQGDIAATEVVATAPIDIDVMDCVKGAMRTWTFTRPRGGPVPVERAFHFRTRVSHP